MIAYAAVSGGRRRRIGVVGSVDRPLFWAAFHRLGCRNFYVMDQYRAQKKKHVEHVKAAANPLCELSLVPQHSSSPGEADGDVNSLV